MRGLGLCLPDIWLQSPAAQSDLERALAAKFKAKGVVTDGLIAWLDGADFTNSPETTSWTDKSGNGNHAACTGFAYTAASGSDGQGGVVYDGIDDRAEIYRSNTDITDFTFECRIKPASINANVFIGAGLDSPAIAVSESELKFYYNGFFNTGKILEVGTSYLIAVRRTGNLVEHFSDGIKLDFSETIVFTVGENFTIGHDKGSALFIGTIYLARIYNRALSDAEILRNNNAS